MMFNRLKALRDKLASVPAFSCDAETRKELVAAIDELDDAMVMEIRGHEQARLNAAQRDRMHDEFVTEMLHRFGVAPTTRENVA